MLKKIINRKIRKLFTLQTAFVVVNLLFVISVILIFILSKKNGIVNVFAFLLIYLVYMMIENLLSEINKEKRKELKIIRPNKRFTHKNEETGAIELQSKDISEAVLFLYDVENKISKIDV